MCTTFTCNNGCFESAGHSTVSLCLFCCMCKCTMLDLTGYGKMMTVYHVTCKAVSSFSPPPFFFYPSVTSKNISAIFHLHLYSVVFSCTDLTVQMSANTRRQVAIARNQASLPSVERLGETTSPLLYPQTLYSPVSIANHTVKLLSKIRNRIPQINREFDRLHVDSLDASRCHPPIPRADAISSVPQFRCNPKASAEEE